MFKLLMFLIILGSNTIFVLTSIVIVNHFEDKKRTVNDEVNNVNY